MNSRKPIRLYAVYFASLLFAFVYALPFFPSPSQPVRQPIADPERFSAPISSAPLIPAANPTAVPQVTSIPLTAKQSVQLGADDYEAYNRAFISESPELQDFISAVRDGQPDVVRGVYVPGVFALPVIQQPKDDVTYVSQDLGVVTQFSSAARNGITGLLAHNFLSGQLFYKLKAGQMVSIIYGDGRVENHRIVDIQRFQKLSPNSMQSKYRDLSDNEILTTSQVFSRFYRGDHKVIFQTCLEGDGTLSWGLIFIVAEPEGE